MQSFTFCPWKYYLEKILGIVPATISPNLVRGRIGHDVMTHGMELFDPLFDGAIAYYSSPAFTEAMNPLSLDEKDAKKMKSDLKLICQNAIDVCHTKGIELTEQENTMQFKVGPYDFEGTTDVIGRMPGTPEGYVELIDWKFGRKQSNEQLNRNLQHGLYYVMLRQHGYKVNSNWWVHMNDFLPYVKKGKHGDVGDLRGPGFYPILITDKDIPYIEKQTLQICEDIIVGNFIQHSYGPNAPCPYCEYKDSSKCPRFDVGTTIQEEA
jgi:hypothetical protein